jgi:hypothetical protein
VRHSQPLLQGGGEARAGLDVAEVEHEDELLRGIVEADPRRVVHIGHFGIVREVENVIAVLVELRRGEGILKKAIIGKRRNGSGVGGFEADDEREGDLVK